MNKETTNKPIRSGAREVIFNVFQRCFAEYQAGRILSDLEDVYARTALLTRKSESTIRRIVNEGFTNNGVFKMPGKKRVERPKKEMDDFTICALRQKNQFFYTVKKEIPTLKKLLAIAKSDLEFNCSQEHLRKILKSIGFSYKKCQSNRLDLIEKPFISEKREEYLRIIIKNRALPEELQKDIIYIDESYIHDSFKVKKCWQSIDIHGVQSSVSKGKRYIIVHAGSSKGFVPNCMLVFSGKNKIDDYHSEMNAHNFTKWISEKLIPNLHENSIIVFDNVPYHSIIKNKAPNSSSRVDEIKLWLMENNIAFDPSLRKPSLLKLVKNNKPDPIYAVDELLGQHGHIVARLHCDLNPIELIWALAKKKVAERNVGTCDVKSLTEDALNSITPQNWKNCCEHVIKIEKEYHECGRTLYSDIDDLIIQVESDDSSSNRDLSGVDYLEVSSE